MAISLLKESMWHHTLTQHNHLQQKRGTRVELRSKARQTEGILSESMRDKAQEMAKEALVRYTCPVLGCTCGSRECIASGASSVARQGCHMWRISIASIA